jgi:hypothetical protein
MKFRPNFAMHSLPQVSRPKRQLSYFNGRFVATLNSAMVSAILGANHKVGERFNCVLSITLLATDVKALRKAMDGKELDECLIDLDEALEGQDNVVLSLNPQMAAIFAPFTSKNGINPTYWCEFNWKGAEILSEVCQEDDNNDVASFGDDLVTLMADLKRRREDYESRMGSTPKGYTSAPEDE